MAWTRRRARSSTSGGSPRPTGRPASAGGRGRRRSGACGRSSRAARGEPPGPRPRHEFATLGDGSRGDLVVWAQELLPRHRSRRPGQRQVRRRRPSGRSGRCSAAAASRSPARSTTRPGRCCSADEPETVRWSPPREPCRGRPAGTRRAPATACCRRSSTRSRRRRSGPDEGPARLVVGVAAALPCSRCRRSPAPRPRATPPTRRARSTSSRSRSGRRTPKLQGPDRRQQPAAAPTGAAAPSRVREGQGRSAISASTSPPQSIGRRLYCPAGSTRNGRIDVGVSRGRQACGPREGLGRRPDRPLEARAGAASSASTALGIEPGKLSFSAVEQLVRPGLRPRRERGRRPSASTAPLPKGAREDADQPGPPRRLHRRRPRHGLPRSEPAQVGRAHLRRRPEHLHRRRSADPRPQPRPRARSSRSASRSPPTPASTARSSPTATRSATTPGATRWGRASRTCVRPAT